MWTIFLTLTIWTVDPISHWIEDLQAKYAPDRRLAFFEVEVERQGKVFLLNGETNQPAAHQELLDSLNAHDLDFEDRVQLLVPRYALVNVSVCNIRSNPKHSAELSTQSLLGSVMRVYKSNEDWHYVQTPDGYLGWLDDGALHFMDQLSWDRYQSSKKVVVVQPFAFVRGQDDGEFVSDLVEGNILTALDQAEDRTVVGLPDGRIGVIVNDAVSDYHEFLEIKEPLGDNILEKAHQMMGRPYLWGGTSGKGMDCSGFTKTIYFMNGLELPRDASQQVRVGVEVKVDESLEGLQRGDFLFFGRKASPDQRERIWHVAIYLGDGKIIHASERVRIESLRPGDPDFAPERLRTLIRAKRMLENIGENGVKRLVDHPLYNF